MPELPEVQALVDFLAERTVGLAVTGVELGSFSVLKTFDPTPTALAGGMVDGWSRHGKFLDLNVDGIHLVFHLARAGWLRWSEALPHTVMRPGSLLFVGHSENFTDSKDIFRLRGKTVYERV